jgi:hypothetical protein
VTTSGTYTGTYTVVDIRRVGDCFAADYDMVAQATGLASQGLVTDTVHDVKLLAEMGYLAGVDIVLQDRYGRVIRAAKYTVSTDASLWATQRPGNNLWPRIADGSLVVVVSYTDKWWNLGEEHRRTFQRGYLRISWVPSGIDLNYPGLFGQVDRRYASNAYGMERTSYS